MATTPPPGVSGYGTVTQQGGPKYAPVPNPQAIPNPNDAWLKQHGMPSGMTMVGGVPTGDASMIKPGDTVVKGSDGITTVLGANGLSWRVGAPPSSDSGGGDGGGGAPAAAKAPAAPKPPSAPTKVQGPQKAKQLLPAFSPPALNQFTSFYDPNQYIPVQGSSNLPAGYSGQTAPDIGGQAAIAQMMGIPWSAQTLNLNAQGGYGMPPVDMSKGGGLKSNYVNPATYGFVSPVLNPAWYQGARSTAK